MGELTNALQGKLNTRKGHVKDSTGRQLDLFSSLADREAPSPKLVMAKPDAPAALPHPEPELVLPSPGAPPEVAADVRAVLSQSGPVRPVEPDAPAGEAHVQLRTGIYQRPRRPAAPPVPPAPPRTLTRSRFAWVARLQDWFAGVELDRRLVSLVVVLSLLVALIAFWTAGPRQAPPPAGVSMDVQEPRLDPRPAAGNPEVSAMPAPLADPVAAAPRPAAAAPPPPAASWSIPGTAVVQTGGGVLLRFADPVFVSADRISIEGWAALKAVAAKLVSLESGTRVIVTGHTDNVPLSKPTPQFKNNADLAAARAKAAVEHLSQFARVNKGLAFEARTGSLAEAPYPNDTPQNRKLNRTVTIQVVPAP